MCSAGGLARVQTIEGASRQRESRQRAPEQAEAWGIWKARKVHAEEPRRAVVGRQAGRQRSRGCFQAASRSPGSHLKGRTLKGFGEQM